MVGKFLAKEKTAYKDACRRLREDLLPKVNFIVTTMANTGPPELYRIFSVKTCWMDEASMPTIAESLVVSNAFPGLPCVLSNDT